MTRKFGPYYGHFFHQLYHIRATKRGDLSDHFVTSESEQPIAMSDVDNGDFFGMILGQTRFELRTVFFSVSQHRRQCQSIQKTLRHPRALIDIQVG